MNRSGVTLRVFLLALPLGAATERRLDDDRGTGTFLFKDVPCRQAWGIVLRSMGLDSRIYANSVITVENQKNR